jgi:uncharacterized membrane protein YadS
MSLYPVHLTTSFTNEENNTIFMSVTVYDTAIEVVAAGPTSAVEHRWTLQEARELRDLLNRIKLD